MHVRDEERGGEMGGRKKIKMKRMLTTEERCYSVSKMSHDMKKGLSKEGIGHERLLSTGIYLHPHQIVFKNSSKKDE